MSGSGITVWGLPPRGSIIPKPGLTNQVAIAGVPVIVFTGPLNGAYLTNPESAADQGLPDTEQLYIDPVHSPGGADGMGSGTTSALDPGQTWSLPGAIPSGVTVRVNAPSAGHKFTAVQWALAFGLLVLPSLANAQPGPPTPVLKSSVGKPNGVPGLDPNSGMMLRSNPTNGPGPDSLIKAINGGTKPYQGFQTYQAGVHQFYSYDGSEQFRVSVQQGASEFWEAQGGLTGTGATLLARNQSDAGEGAVMGNLTMQDAGCLRVGGGYGQMFNVCPSAGSSGPIITIRPANASTSPGGATASITSDGDIAIIAAGAGRTTNCIPDGQDGGCGNDRGNGAFDFMSSRLLKTQVAAGSNSAAIGGSNNTIGPAATDSVAIGGTGNSMTGPHAAMFGNSASDKGRYGTIGYASGTNGNKGANQWGVGVLRVSGTNADGELIPTANAAVPDGTNCYNLIGGQAIGFIARIVGNTHNTLNLWSIDYYFVGIQSNANGTMNIDAGTSLAHRGSAAPTITFSADATNGCIRAHITAPVPANPAQPETWNYSVILDAAEAQ